MGVRTEVHGAVGLVELRDPPHNFLSESQVAAIADALEAFDADNTIGAVLLAAEGRSFCAGANFAAESGDGLRNSPEDLYAQAARLFEVSIPVVAAVQGPAIGGGLGLAMAATFRITCPQARFSANFVKLGIHQGFGLSETLPETIGPQRAAEVLLTGRRYNGEQAAEIGLADRCVPFDELRDAASDFARELSTGAPLALRSINSTLRAGFADRVRAATAREAAEQGRLFSTEDAREGMRAVSERRDGRFVGR